MLKLRPSLVYQVKADMCRAIVAALITVVMGSARAGKLNRLARYLALGELAALRYLFHDVAVEVTGWEIHLAINSSRVLTQCPLDVTHRLHERTPVHRVKEAEAANAVAHRDLISGLLLVLRLHQLLDRQSTLGESLLNPCEWHCQSGTLPLQSACKFRYKRTHQGLVRTRHVRDHQNKVLRVLLSGLRHLVCPIISAVPVDPVSGDPGCNAPEILDQRQEQHDGDCPQFA